MKRIGLWGSLLALFFLVGAANAQSADVAFAISGLTSPSPSAAVINSGNFYNPSIGGGTYLGFAGDVLIKHNFGVQGEINWRATQNLYLGYQPYRPLLFAFNAIYAPPLGKHAAFEVLGGLGAESVRFYTNYYNCSYFGGCTNYQSSNHFLVDVGAGLKLYPYGHFFIRPEVRGYFVNNNVEFNSGRIIRAGVSLGYTFGGE